MALRIPLRMYSVYDRKAESWSFPFKSDNNATAIRDFSSLVLDGRTLVGQHPEDFDLFFVGTFGLSDGCIKSDPPQHIANGKDFKKEDK